MKKNKTLKRFLAFFLCAAMMITYMPSSVYTLADESNNDQAAAVQEEPAPKKAESPAPAEKKAEEQAQEPESPKAEEPAPVKDEVTKSDALDPDAQGEKTEVDGETSDTSGAVETKKSDGENAESDAKAVDEEPAVTDDGKKGDRAIHTVTFKVDGETVKEVEVAEGSTVGDADMPDEPNRDKYLFDGWFYSVDGTETEFMSDTEVNEDITATARFTENFWTVKFRNRDGEVISEYTKTVTKGDALGTLPETVYREDYVGYWAIGSYDASGQGSWTAGDRIDATYVPTSDVNIVPDYDKINYTVTFYEEDKSTEVATRTVNADTSYCLNDIPDVPAKNGYAGKWVYSGGDFSNNVTITEDTDVWAEYDQNVFTVRFIVDGKEYQSDTYYKGNTLTLPKEPVVDGKEFQGWFVGDTQYTGGETINSDLEIAAKFTDMYYVRFVVQNGDEQEFLSQYFRTGNEPIGTMPQDPFVAGKVFEKWVIQGTDTEVTADTIVSENMIVEAVFRTIEIYDITAEYYYINDRGTEVIFNKDYLQVETHEIPYTITAPSTTQTSPDEVAGAPIYYPETPTITVEEGDFDAQNKCTVRFKYVEYTATYSFVYLLKNLNDDGYTEIAREDNIHGVLNSYVTPEVKNFDYAVLELAQGETIGQAEGQELNVYYTRKNFTLTYETNGGTHVGGVTVPYGTQQEVTSDVPTRTGYTFAGWYLDEGLTQPAGSTVTVNQNTTLYAKWTGETVNYTIVYMFEKFNDAGTQSSFVYDNSETGSGTVGDTIYANSSSIPDKTKTGWEKDNARNASSSVVIAADGSSVLYVYYKLREYTFQFNAGSYYGNGITATLVGLDSGGTGTLSYTMTVKLGQSISSTWPGTVTGFYTTQSGGCGGGTTDHDVTFNGWRNPRDDTSYVTKRDIVTEEMLPGSGNSITYTAQWASSGSTYTVNYWLQNADDDEYTRSEEYSQTYTSSGGNLGAKEIAGYTYDHGNSGQQATTYNFYYNRDTFKIDYYYGSDLLDTIESIKFDANINKAPYVWTPTAVQCGVDSDYTFAGWYDNPDCQGDAYSFDKMPASNMVLYAKWTAPSYTVSYVDGDSPSTEVADSQTVEKYDRAPIPETTPTKDGYVFDGWYSTATGSDYFDWTTQITADTTVYAHWSRQTLSYTVHYVDGDGESLAPDKVVSNPNYVVGQTITEQAIAIAGYRPNTNSETLDLTSDDSENVITFVYSAKSGTTSYKVRYIIDSGEEIGAGAAVAAEKTVSNVEGDTASVIEMAAAVDYDALYEAYPSLEGVQFFPDSVEKTLILTADASQNVLTFYYSSFKHATVTVHYVDMAGEPIADDVTETLKVGKTFTLARTPISGWELNKAAVGTSYSGSEAGNSYKITDEVADHGTLEFTLFYQKKAIISVIDRSKQYDGTPLYLPEGLNNQVEVTGLITGILNRDRLESVDFTYTNADSTDHRGRLNAGIATVTPYNAVITGPHADVDNYYIFRYISGTLEVNKINVTIRVEPDRWVGAIYNGTEYKAGFTNTSKTRDDYLMISHAGYEETYGDQIWADILAKAEFHDASAPNFGAYGIAKTDAGDYNYTIDYTRADLPVNDNYSVSLFVRGGRLQILPRPVTVTTGSGEKAYDGTPLTNEEATISEQEGDNDNTGLIPADKAKGVTITATGTITDPGSETNSYSIDWGTANANNYAINEDLGTLEVTTASLSVVVKDKTVYYNGSLQYGNDIPSEITGTGNQIIEDGYEVTGLAEGDVLHLTYNKASGTNVNTTTGYDGEFSTEYSITRNGEDVTAFYGRPTATAGKLYIQPATVIINITGNTDDTVIYDGEEHSVTGFTATSVSNLFNASKVSYGENEPPMADPLVAEAKGTDAGTYYMHLRESGFSYDDENVIATFNIVSDGSLTINQREVTVSVEDKSTEYNGSEQYGNTEYTFDGLVEGHEGSITYTPSSGTLVGTYTNGSYGDDFKVTAGLTHRNVTDNYILKTKTIGNLAITDRTEKYEITVKANSNTGNVYDGTEKSATGFETLQFTIDNNTYTVEGLTTSNPSSINVCNLTNAISGTAVVKDAAGNDVTAQFTVNTTNGTLEITAREVTVSVADISKQYNGSEQTGNTAYTFSNVVEGQTATITYTPAKGKLTGTYDNGSYGTDFAVVDGEGNDVTANYTLGTQTKGKLTITNREQKYQITVVAKSNTGNVYDGTVKSAEGFETLEFEVEGNTYTVEGLTTSDPSSTNVCSLPNAISGTAVVKDAAGNDVTAQFTVNTTDGTLEITAREVSVSVENRTLEYNGSEQEGYDQASFNNVVSGQNASISYTPAKGTLVGIYTNGSYGSDFKVVDANNIDVTSNYSLIDQTAGNLTITDRTEKYEITVVANSSTGNIYDGTAKSATGFETLEFTVDGNTYAVEGLTTSDPSSTNVCSLTNAISGTAVVRDAAGNDVTAQFTVNKTNGTLEITAREVTVSVADKTVEYNGSEQEGNTAYTFSNVVNGQTATITYGPSYGTLVGEYTNGVFLESTFKVVDASNNDVTDNYTLGTQKVGKLTITDRKEKYEITVVANSSTGNTYDGTAKSATGFVATSFNVDGHTYTVEGLTTSDPSSTDVCSLPNTISGTAVVKDVAGNNVTDQFTVNTTNGTLEITAREVTVSVADKTVEYNGSEQSGNTEYTFDNVVSGQTATITYTPSSGKLVGTYDNGSYGTDFAVVDGDGNDVTANYTLGTQTAGKLTITDRTEKYEITVVANSSTGNVYDGTAKSAEGFETLEFTVEGNTYTVEGLTTSDPSSTNVCSLTNAISGTAVVRDAAGNDVTAQFTVNTTDGSLVISEREVTVKVEDRTAEYNGVVQYGNSTYTFNNVVSGQTATITYTPSSGKLVGTYDNGSYGTDFAVVDGDGNDVTANYTLGTQTAGKLTITDRTEKYEITVVANSSTGNVYDGTAKSATGFETLEFTIDNNTYTVEGLTTSDPSSTNVCSLTNAISGTAVVKDAAGNDVTAQFTVNTTDGTLEITAREVTVSVTDKTVEYNGSEQSGNTEYSFSNVAANQTATITYTPAKGTLVGTYDNGAYNANTFKVEDANGNDVTDNYTLGTQTAGKLRIKDRTDKYEIEVVANSSTGNVYDGTVKSAAGFETLSFERDDNTYTVEGLTTSDPSSTNVCSLTNAISGTAVVKDADGNDVTAQFNVSTTNGTLEITAREVTVSVTDKTVEYNGSEQSGNTTYTFDNVVSGQTATITYTPSSGKLVGTYDNGSYGTDFAVVDGEGNDVTANYTLGTKTAGKLTITDRTEKYEITVVANSSTGNVYDGTAKSATGFETLEFTVDNNTYTVEGLMTSDPSSTNVCSLPNAISGTAVVKDAAGNDVTAQFTVNTTDGTLEITAREVTVSVEDKTVEYNGSAQEGNKAYTFNNVVSGQTATITYGPSYGTLVGEYTNGVFAESTFKVVDASNNDVTDNYMLGTKTAGKLTITDRTEKYEITVVANSNTGNVYDGTAKSATGFETLEFTIDNNTYTVEGLTTSDPSSTNVCSLTNAISGTAVVKDAANNDVTAQFNVSTTNGTLEITAREVTVSVEDTTKTYNGSVQSGLEEYTFSNVVDGQTATITYTPSSGKLVGTYDNGAYNANTFKVEDANGNDVTDNYTLGTQTAGKLTIKNREDKYEIEVVANSSDTVYDGQPHSAAGFKTLEFTVDNNTYTVEGLMTSNPSSTNVCNLTNAISGTAVVKDADGNDVTAQFNVSTTNGTLVIKPLEITVTVKGNTASAEYDGKKHTVSGYTATASSNLYDVENDFSYTGTASASRTNVVEGSDTDGKTEMGLDETLFNNQNSNFSVTFEVEEDGYVEIKPLAVTVTINGNSSNPTYNGKEQVVSGYTAAASSDLFDTDNDITMQGKAEAKGTDAGTYEMGLDESQFSSSNTNFNVTFKIGKDGSLTIETAKLVVEADDQTKVYGSKDPEFTVSIVEGKLFGEDEIKYDISRDPGEDVGSYTIKLEEGESFILKALGLSKDNYDITFRNGTLTITKAKLTITTGSGSKTYDGSALTNPTANITGLVNGDKATVKANGSQTAVGSSKNTVDINDIKWTKGSAKNYEITKKLGTLTVSAAGGGDGPAPGPGGGGGAPVTPAGPTDDGTVIPDEPTPEVEPETIIPDHPTPTAEGTWALINLISAIVTALGAVVALLRKKEDEDENEDNMYKEEDEDDNRSKKMLAAKIAGALAGVAAPITFFLTEDMSLPMAMIDKWTVLMVAMLAVQVVAAVFNKKASENDNDQETAEDAAN